MTHVITEDDSRLVKIKGMPRNTAVDVKDILDIVAFYDVGPIKNKVVICKQEVRDGLISQLILMP